MKSFNVLERSLNVHRSYFLEASAGTGKTFSIENLVVRLIVENFKDQKPLALHQILVVTFTRAATRELKMRIFSHLEKAIEYLKNPVEDMPDYLAALCDQGQETVIQAKRYLEKAASDFDEAQIFTIHSFCYRMLREYTLESHVGFDLSSPEEEYPMATIQAVVRDFFLTELDPLKYSSEQLRLLLKDHRGDAQELENKMVKEISQEKETKNLSTFEQLFQSFKQIVEALQSKWSIVPENLKTDLIVLSSCYKGFCNQQGVIKTDIEERIEKFSQLFINEITIADFNFFIEDRAEWLDLYKESNKKARSKTPSFLFYYGFLTDIHQSMFPILQEASSAKKIFNRMADDCRKLLSFRFYQEEKWTPDELLKVMHRSLKHEKFNDRVFQRYQAVIIDEFQDTDPLQWEIFSQCFFKYDEKRLCYLVGDPKQSIYAFRKADIYTYLNAQGLLGESACASLDTNYRSQKPLVEALNALFDTNTVPDWMSLPRWGKALSIPKVKSAPLKEDYHFIDEQGSVHFFVVQGTSTGKQWPSQSIESDVLFPYMAKEINTMMINQSMGAESFAVLVKDRYQAERLRHYLQTVGIAAVTKRSKSLIETDAYQAFKELIKALDHTSTSSLMRQVLGGPLFGLNHHQLRKFTEPEEEQKLFYYFANLRLSLIEKGVAYFYNTLMATQFDGQNSTISQRILSEKEGIFFYRDCNRLMEILVEEESRQGTSPNVLYNALNLLALRDPDDERLRLHTEEETGSVQILTTHMSKGLEYDVVFALGLASRTQVSDECDSSELDAEKMRQLYVAMTRAKKRLYVPILFDMKKKPLIPGTASPMELFCARFGRAALTIEKLYEQIGHSNEIFTALDTLKRTSSITYSNLDNPYHYSPPIVEHQKIVLNCPPTWNIHYSTSYITSYTSMADVKDNAHVKRDILENDLPLGAETGIIIHEILQKISWNQMKQAQSAQDLVPLTELFLKATSLRDHFVKIAEHLFAIFNAKIVSSFSSFQLKDVDEKVLWREMEFSFGHQDNFINGFIDLVFRHEGKYYLVDWKSNHLGTDYSTKSMREEMEAKDYFLQARIYKEALKRYLTLTTKEQFDKVYGGAIYIFLRGCQPDTSLGIYHVIEEGDQ
ncbi:MAG: UvrD-helicase domain-containing protein [Parachlamydiales bacterium]|nr:UvrD-helicase domain-containing protein [Parachlamydiales bacterium]